jgi:hypothetical protein
MTNYSEISDKVKRHRMLMALAEILPSTNRNLLIQLFTFLSHASKNLGKDRLVKIFGRLVFRPTPDISTETVNAVTSEYIEYPGLWVIVRECVSFLRPFSPLGARPDVWYCWLPPGR